jgi:lipid-binding SYLF domain-containing protein
MKYPARLAAVVAMGGLLAAPAYAANNTSNAQDIVNNAVQALNNAKQQSRFEGFLKHAKGVFIIPSLKKGALIVGGEGGEGVLLAREHGTWSDPAFLSIGSISVGAQAGGEAGPVIMVLMTHKALNDFTQANNFSLNANAGLTIVNYSAKGQAPVGKGDIIVWSNASGGFAGADISGTDITNNKHQDESYYGRKVTTAQIMHGKANNPKADPLRNALPS